MMVLMGPPGPQLDRKPQGFIWKDAQLHTTRKKPKLKFNVHIYRRQLRKVSYSMFF